MASSDIDAGPRPGLDESALRDLRGALRGEVLTNADEGYQTHRRVWNGSIDRRPRVIVRCTGVDDVRAAVAFGRRHDLPIALRGGGHSFPGLSTVDDGLLVDLRPMDRIEVDPQARTARAQAGLLLEEVDAATQPHGLAVPAGIVSHTGLAGLTLGGGIGWIMRRHGLTVDQLTGVELVTADGDVVRADEEETPTCSGPSAAVAATSAWSRRSTSGWCRSARRSSREWPSGRRRMARRCCGSTATGWASAPTTS